MFRFQDTPTQSTNHTAYILTPPFTMRPEVKIGNASASSAGNDALSELRNVVSTPNYAN